jgi:hypothetical protein
MNLFQEAQYNMLTRQKFSTQQRKTLCEMRGVVLYYIAAQFVNFNSIRKMILGANITDITVSTERKIKRKMGICDGSGQKVTVRARGGVLQAVRRVLLRTLRVYKGRAGRIES